MVVRAMQIHKMAAEFLEEREIAGIAVDELASVPLGDKDALENEFPLLARLHPVFIQQGIDLSALIKMKHCLNRGRGGSRSYHAALRTLTKQEF
jgi:hypothetical protein